MSLHNDPNCVTSRCPAAHLVISLGLSLSSNTTYCPTQTLTFCPLTSLLPQIYAPGQTWDSRQIQTIKSFIPINKPQNKIEYHSPCSRVCRTLSILSPFYLFFLWFPLLSLFNFWDFLSSFWNHPSIHFQPLQIMIIKIIIGDALFSHWFYSDFAVPYFPHGGSSYLGRCLPNVLSPFFTITLCCRGRRFSHRALFVYHHSKCVWAQIHTSAYQSFRV